MFFLRKYFANKNIVFEQVNENNLDKYDSFIFYSYVNVKLIKKLYKMNKLCHSIYIQLEPPLVEFMHNKINMNLLSNVFGAVLTWYDDLVDNEKFYKLYVPMPKKDRDVIVSFKDKKLACLIAGSHPKHQTFVADSLYGKRIEAIKFFEQYHKEMFDLYGANWNKLQYPSYLGKVDNKVETFKNYKFAICYENQENIDGYITEKIFDCFYSNCVPVYWGQNNIERYVPKKCFISKKDFSTYDELYDYIYNMKEEEYQKDLNEIGLFLNSKAFDKFLPLNYATTIDDVLNKLQTKKQDIDIKKNQLKSWKLSYFTNSIAVV